ncbi:MAG: S41 family peptidase [Candidatus Sericytochromatia bacterium]
MKYKKILTLLPISLLLTSMDALAITSEKKIDNLKAFAKLYGYVKYFHPSDEAASINWDKFAIYGSQKVKNAKNKEELKNILEELFLPIAPTAQIYFSNQKPESFDKYKKNDKNLKVVAWQHKGVGFGSPNSIYSSIRVNKDNIILNKGGFASISQSINASKLKNKEFKFKVFAKALVNGENNDGHLWINVQKENGQAGFFNNMYDNPIKLNEWKEYEIKGKIDSDAKNINLGVFMQGVGKIWFDKLQLLIKENDNWVPINIENSNFENSTKELLPSNWLIDEDGYNVKNTSEDFYEGKKSLLMEDKVKTFNGTLFEKYPKIGEVINKKLNNDLSCQIPLALYTDDKTTIGKNEKFNFSTFSKNFDTFSFDKVSPKDEEFRFGDIVIAWNVFQHFYPYFDLVKVNWDKELTNSLEKTLKDKDKEDFDLTLRSLVEKLKDGHGNVYSNVYNKKLFNFPFIVDWVENNVVVIASTIDEVKKGDIILSVDNKKVSDILSDKEKLISGSPQWKKHRALREFASDEQGKKSKLEIKRADKNIILELERNIFVFKQINELKDNKIEKLENNIYYINLNNAEIKDIEDKIKDLSLAKGVIFDLRGYPNGNHDVLSYLTNESLDSSKWNIPLIIYPDQENIVGYDTSGRWKLKPKNPKFKGKIVFLTDSRAISYAESFLAIVENYKLGEILGQTTAGANGNVNPFTLPGNFDISWTGMKVLKHDNSNFHLLGVKPTIPVEKTIKGIIEGKDEYLDKAIEVINNK